MFKEFIIVFLYVKAQIICTLIFGPGGLNLNTLFYYICVIILVHLYIVMYGSFS